MLAHHDSCLKKHNGVALITVLLIVAILTAIVSRLSFSNEIWRRQVENGSAHAQAVQATHAAQMWIDTILSQDKNSFDGMTDTWAQPVIPIPIAWGEMYGWMEDMQGRFNLNNLVNEEGKINSTALLQFENLLHQLQLNPGIAQAVADWIDPDSNTAGIDGAEDIYYIGLESPYMAANRPFVDIEELKLVRGIDLSAWNKLNPLITALPELTSINVNTASAEVLSAVLSDPKSSINIIIEAGIWQQEAQNKPFTRIEDFINQIPKTLNLNNFTSISVSSSYFKAHTQVTFDNVEQRMVTLFHRQNGRVSIVNQSRALF